MKMKSLIVLSVLYLTMAMADAETNLTEYDKLLNNVSRGRIHIDVEHVEDLILEAERAAKDIAVETERQVKEIILYPVHVLEDAVADVEARLEENKECTSGEILHANEVAENALHDYFNCGTYAAQNAADLVIDTTRALHQLTFDGFALVKQFFKCRRIKKVALKRICQAKLLTMGSLFALNGRKSIKTLLAAPNRIPEIIVEARNCTNQVTDNTLNEFSNIHNNIDQCILHNVEN